MKFMLKEMSDQKIKIGILNYHSGINYGAYLQCYALYKVTDDQGFDAQVINYKNIRHWFLEYRYFLFRINPKILFSNIQKIRNFKKLLKQMELTKFTWIKSLLKYKKFDYIIIGSDEVWNYTNPLVGYDLTYFGKGLSASKLASYAASFGWLNSDVELPAEVKELISKFDLISVRDENSRTIISNNIGIDVPVVLDPTMLYGFDREMADTKIPSGLEEDYLLLYSPGGIIDERHDDLIDYCKDKKLQIVSLGNYHACADINLLTIDPFQWLVLIRKAKFIVTSSFHGVVFSVKFRKQFISSPNKASYNKISSLLHEFNLSDRIFYHSEDELTHDDINYSSLQPLIDIKIEQSRTTLFNFLGVL